MDFNDKIVDTFRANGGEVNEPMAWGRNLVLVHVEKKDGTTRIIPLWSIRTDDGWHVAGTAGGSPDHPAWVFNLRRMERTVLEVPGDPIETVPVTVAELAGAERDDLWAQYRRLPGFRDYEAKAEGRVFPVFRFAPAA